MKAPLLGSPIALSTAAALEAHYAAMDGGAYTADRAASLSGVPRSTVHYWAREKILVPSVSGQRVKLWSYSDLLALRTVYWLRQRKTSEAGHEIPRTAMPVVRRALGRLRELDLDLFHDGRPTILVDERGDVLIRPPAEPTQRLSGQTLVEDMLDVIAPFATSERTCGVDLIEPSRLVRIVPRKLSGAPHVVDTRIHTEALASLSKRGFGVGDIGGLYPDLTRAQIDDALIFERLLETNLAA